MKHFQCLPYSKRQPAESASDKLHIENVDADAASTLMMYSNLQKNLAPAITANILFPMACTNVPFQSSCLAPWGP